MSLQLYRELVFEMKRKLGRDLTAKELQLLNWVELRKTEELYKRMKSS
ncbi:hypothetical protein [Bacillus alkalicellulosilyticus]|nr:hypothetical protein [Bacillus alkalicellulosilyticus]